MEWTNDKADYVEKIEGGERRFYAHPVEYREDDEGTIEGIASKVNKWYDLGWFEERIAKGAFDDVLKNDDVRALFNHDPNLVLARTKSKTLNLSVNKTGDLVYGYKTPDRQYAKDLENTIRTGDVDQSSFAFRVKEETWEWASDDEDLKKDRRTITKIEKLFDVSPVTYAASPSTKVAARKQTDHEQELKRAKQAKIDKQNKLKIIGAEMKLRELNLGENGRD